MKDPCHPGELIRHDCIEALGLTVAAAAEHLQLTQDALTAVCECRAPVPADLAIRFEMAFGSTADFWLRLQAAYDLAQARKSAGQITRIERAA